MDQAAVMDGQAQSSLALASFQSDWNAADEAFGRWEAAVKARCDAQFLLMGFTPKGPSTWQRRREPLRSLPGLPLLAQCLLMPLEQLVVQAQHRWSEAFIELERRRIAWPMLVIGLDAIRLEAATAISRLIPTNEYSLATNDIAGGVSKVRELSDWLLVELEEQYRLAAAVLAKAESARSAASNYKLRRFFDQRAIRWNSRRRRIYRIGRRLYEETSSMISAMTTRTRAG